MNLEELYVLKKDLEDIYVEEKEKYNSTDLDSKKKKIFEDELNDIAKEHTKVENLIKIYKNTDKEYIVMRLERLYMMLISGLDENKFNELDDNKQFEIFDKYFPDEWVITYNINQKEKLLLDAICQNKILVREKNSDCGNKSELGD